jgi:hypothetical protein
VFTGFEKFVEAAASHTDGGGEDIVLKFLHSSPECSEIFHVLEVQQKKVHEVYHSLVNLITQKHLFFLITGKFSLI